MVNPDEYPISTYATLFPEIAPEEYAQMVVSIGEVGLLDPVTLWREQVRWPASSQGLPRGWRRAQV